MMLDDVKGKARATRLGLWCKAPMLIVAEAYGPRLHSEKVAAAVASGLLAAGLPEPTTCPLAPLSHKRLSAFEENMRAAKAIVIATRRLDEQTLLGSVPFEVATKARQAGVPAYAIAKEAELTAFDARILDLQAVLQARSERALRAAGRMLAAIV